MTKEDVNAEIERLIEKFGITDRSGRLAVTLHVWGLALYEEDEPTREEIAFEARKLARKTLRDTYIKKFIGDVDDTPIKLRRCDGMD